MAVVDPIGFARAAARQQLADPVKGLNPNLQAFSSRYNVPSWQFDFSAASRNFFEANVDYAQTEETDVAQANLLVLYGLTATAFPDNQRVFSASFSGRVELYADMYIGFLGEKIQNFEWWGDAARAAMLATVNNVSNQNGLNARDAATNSGKAYAMDLDFKPSKASYDGENWVLPLRFVMGFGVLIP